MQEDWKTYKLGKIIDYQKGFAFKSEWYQNTGSLVVRVSDTTNNSIDISTCNKIDDHLASECHRFKLNYNDIVIATVGSWPPNYSSVVGKVIKVPKEADGALLNQNAVRLRTLDEKLFDQSFVYYLMKSNNFLNYIINSAQGSANQASIKLTDIFNYEFLLPCINEQRSIASILTILDDKIELNLQMNKTLEEMAMTLYKHWFVDFGPFQDGEFVDSELGMIPKGWEVKSLRDIAEVNSNTIKNNDTPTDIEYIDIASVNEGWVEEIQPILFSEAPSRARRIISDGDIVWSTVRPNRKSRFLALGFSAKTIVSTGFAVISPKLVPYSYLYPYTCTNEFVEYLVSRATGSSYPAVTGKIFEDAQIIIPGDSILASYNKIAEPMLIQFSLNNIENQTLTTLRDTLLPKLISGEVRIKDAENALAEVL